MRRQFNEVSSHYAVIRTQLKANSERILNWNDIT